MTPPKGTVCLKNTTICLILVTAVAILVLTLLSHNPLPLSFLPKMNKSYFEHLPSYFPSIQFRLDDSENDNSSSLLTPFPDSLDITHNTSDGFQDLRIKLKKLGLERAEDKVFQSPYIITPKFYPLPPGSGHRNSSAKTKVISCFNCPKYFTNGSFNSYNRDFKACPYNRCVVDFPGKKYSPPDLLLVFPNKKPRQPPAHLPWQRWAHCIWESPVHFSYPENYKDWKGQFNWTFNFRRDSDIFAPTNLLAWRDRDQLLTDREYLQIAKRKTKTAAWFVSNCVTQGKREKYVAQMKKYIDVDIYGRCGTLKCQRNIEDECERKLTTTYKFYLSFENSLCTDYVTEKFFRNFAFRSHIVPVVRGGFNYSRYAPRGMYVDAGSFKNAKGLALRLKQLGGDHIQYARMLKEKDKLVALNRKLDWCDICEKLHTAGDKVIPDIKAWSHRKGICHSPNDIG